MQTGVDGGGRDATSEGVGQAETGLTEGCDDPGPRSGAAVGQTVKPLGFFSDLPAACIHGNGYQRGKIR